jgi:hypothetical protein
MSPSLKPSASIVAAGIVAILGSLIVTAFSLFTITVLSSKSFQEFEAGQPGFAKWVAYVFGVCLIAGAVYVFACGIGVMRLRNWARTSLMVISGLLLLFSCIEALVTIFSVLLVNLPGPPDTKWLIVGMLALIFGVPVGVAVWWLILFTRRSVVAQFEARRAASPPGRRIRFSKAGCPLPISIVAWYLLSTVPSAAILPFLHFRIPVLLIGHVVRGPAAALTLSIQFGLIAISSIGLLRLQRWSFPLSVAIQIFVLVNGVGSVLDPRYVEKVRSILDSIHIPFMPSGMPDFLHFARYIAMFFLLLPLACLACLFYSRKAFFDAASSRIDPISLSEGVPHD